MEVSPAHYISNLPFTNAIHQKLKGEIANMMATTGVVAGLPQEHREAVLNRPSLSNNHFIQCNAWYLSSSQANYKSNSHYSHQGTFQCNPTFNINLPEVRILCHHLNHHLPIHLITSLIAPNHHLGPFPALSPDVPYLQSSATSAIILVTMPMNAHHNFHPNLNP